MWQRFKTLAVLGAALLMLQSNNALANVLGSDNQHFNATTNGLDFVTVHSSETLRPGVLNLGFFMNYAVCSSFSQGSQHRTHSSNHSTANSVMNALMFIGFLILTMPEGRSRIGETSLITKDHTALWAI